MEQEREKDAQPELKVDEDTVPSPKDAEHKTESLIGKTVADKFEILSVLGSGGLGTVYRARHNLLDKTVAIKFLSVSSHVNQKALLRFQREGETAVALNHPNIAGVYDFGLYEDQPYLALEYVEGDPLGSILKTEGVLEPARVMGILKQTLAALEYAHDSRIVHRDIKPDNIMICRDSDGQEKVKLIDFGIAKVLESEEESKNLTQTGEVFGTPNYMSPEQCQGKPADTRSDIYSLFCVVFQMLTGEVPFPSESALEVLMDHVSKPAPALSPPHGFAGLETIVARALSKDPGNRYESVKELLKELERVEHGLRPTKMAVEQARYKRKKLVNWSLGLGALLGLGLLVFMWAFSPPSMESLNQRIQSNPQDLQAYLDRGQRYEKAEKYRAAIKDYTKASEIQKNLPAPYFWRARTLSKMGEYEKALADTEMMLKLMPGHYRGYMLRSQVNLGLGNYDDAIADGARAVELNPANEFNNNGISSNYMSSAALGLKQYEKAIQYANQAINFLPSDAAQFLSKAYLNRASAEFYLGQFEKCIADCDKVTVRDPTSSQAFGYKAIALLKTGKVKEALANIGDALMLAPDDAGLYSMRAAANYKLANYQQALDDADKAIKTGKADWEVLTSRALALKRLGRDKDAQLASKEATNAAIESGIAGKKLDLDQLAQGVEDKYFGR